jgi:membrane-associated phospholipid phosphatase
VLVGLSILIFARGLHGVAVEVTVVDDAVVGWLAGRDAPGMVGVWRMLAAVSSWWVLNGLFYGLLVALAVLRRFRQLIVFVIVAQLVSLTAEAWVGAIAQRPRPFGVTIRGGWGGWALPSVQLTYFAALLVVILYTLVPEGRWRNTGKWVAAGLVALTALGRIGLGTEAPTDVLVAAAIGVTIPLLAFAFVGSGFWRSRSCWWCSSCKPSLEASPTMRPTPRRCTSATSPAPIWSRCGWRPSRCRRRRWCHACRSCRSAGRWRR